MGKWHLYNEFKNGVNVGGDIQYVKLLGIIGVFVLLLACINFMNLATARSEKRAKEIGIRKTLGSFRGQLISRFFAESYLIVLLAFLLSLILVASVLPSFNEVAGKKIGIPWQNGLFWLFNLLFIFITGLLAGSYPAFYLSSFNPLKVLKGTFRVGRFTSMPRKVLVVFQFAVSVMLIIGTIVIYQQVQHAKSRPLNYEKAGLINLWFEDEIKRHFTTFRHELSNSGAIEELAATLSPLTSVWKNNNDFEWEGKDPSLTVDFANNVVTYEFGETVKWTIIQGRDFSRTFGTDSLAFVMNQSAAKFIGFEDPIGKTLTWEGKPFTIIGIVKDMLQESPFFPVRPTLYHIGPDDHHALYNLVIRLNPRQPISQSLSTMERIWKKYVPDKPFDYSFVDEDFGNKFSDVERIGKLSSYFAVLAVFISCLGLFGMASFVAEQRTKEIAIRKVLGASIANLWLLLSKDFLLLVLLSCIIATPIARQYLSNWLANYDYRITISWTVFALAAVLAIIITLATISVQAIRTATANPVDSLRDE